jgi:uncharacterized protein (DUF362 family)
MKKQIKVAIAKGDEYHSTLKSLNLIKEDLLEKLGRIKPKKIFLKPNWLQFRKDWLPITKVDTLRAVIDFFSKIGDFSFTAGDATPTIFGWNGKTFLAQANYKILEKEYSCVKVVDLNDYPARKKFLAKTLDGPKPLRYYEPILDAQFLVSVARLKTHDTFINTLSLKNVAIGCAYWQDKILFHATPTADDHREGKPTPKAWFQTILPLVNYNFYQGSKAVYPALSIIDSVQAMEGDGPDLGTAVNLGVTIASTDPLSADIIGTKIMGFKLSDIPYLDILNDERKPNIKVVGQKLSQFKYRFKTHHDHHLHKITKKAVLDLF